MPLSSAQTRYVMKYRHVDGKLELKVTNDRVVRTRRTSGCLALSLRLLTISGNPQCFKFITDQAQDLKRIDKLNNLFLTYMCGKDPAVEPPDGALPVQHEIQCEPHALPALLTQWACYHAQRYWRHRRSGQSDPIAETSLAQRAAGVARRKR
jgi:hypothetical protein